MVFVVLLYIFVLSLFSSVCIVNYCYPNILTDPDSDSQGVRTELLNCYGVPIASTLAIFKPDSTGARLATPDEFLNQRDDIAFITVY